MFLPGALMSQVLFAMMLCLLDVLPMPGEFGKSGSRFRFGCSALGSEVQGLGLRVKILGHHEHIH